MVHLKFILINDISDYITIYLFNYLSTLLLLLFMFCLTFLLAQHAISLLSACYVFIRALILWLLFLSFFCLYYWLNAEMSSEQSCFTLCKETQSVPYSKFNFSSSLRFLLRDHSFRACVFLKRRDLQFVDQTFTRHLLCGRGFYPRPNPSLGLLVFTSYKLNNSYIDIIACLV